MKTFKELRTEISEAAAVSTLMGGSAPTPAETAKVAASKASIPSKSGSMLGRMGKSLGRFGNVMGMALTPDSGREAPDADKPKDYGSSSGLQAAPKPAENKLKTVEPTKPDIAPLAPSVAAPKGGPNYPPTAKPTLASKPAIKPSTGFSQAAKPATKDPNADGGFVTGRAFGSKGAGVTSTQNVNKSPLDTVKLAKQGSSERSAQMKSMGFKEF